MRKKTFHSSGLLALTVLVIQNTALAILLKLTTRPGAASYSSASVVVMAETIKFFVCSLMVSRDSLKDLVPMLASTVRRDQLVLFLPSLLYVVQNNLLIFGAKLLPTIVYVVCTQMKILTTALVSRLVLKTQFTKTECVSLLFLATGIVVVQNVQNQDQTLKSNQLEKTHVSWTVGVAAVLFASLTSAIAGVTLEKIYEQRSSKLPVDVQKKRSFEHTIWTRNAQLSMISVPFAVLGACSYSHDLFTSDELTNGFDSYVWCVVALQVLGGIVTAYVMKFANNILKCLAISISICCCAVYSVAKNDLQPTMPLVAGVIIVVLSVFVFSTTAHPTTDL